MLLPRDAGRTPQITDVSRPRTRVHPRRYECPRPVCHEGAGPAGLLHPNLFSPPPAFHTGACPWQPRIGPRIGSRATSPQSGSTDRTTDVSPLSAHSRLSADEVGATVVSASCGSGKRLGYRQAHGYSTMIVLRENLVDRLTKPMVRSHGYTLTQFLAPELLSWAKPYTCIHLSLANTPAAQGFLRLPIICLPA